MLFMTDQRKERRVCKDIQVQHFTSICSANITKIIQNDYQSGMYHIFILAGGVYLQVYSALARVFAKSMMHKYAKIVPNNVNIYLLHLLQGCLWWVNIPAKSRCLAYLIWERGRGTSMMQFCQKSFALFIVLDAKMVRDFLSYSSCVFQKGCSFHYNWGWGHALILKVNQGTHNLVQNLKNEDVKAGVTNPGVS